MVFEVLQGIILDQLGVDICRMDPDSSLREDLGADSLDLIELIVACTREFGDDLFEDEAAARTISTVGEFAAYIEGRFVGCPLPLTGLPTDAGGLAQQEEKAQGGASK